MTNPLARLAAIVNRTDDDNSFRPEIAAILLLAVIVWAIVAMVLLVGWAPFAGIPLAVAALVAVYRWVTR